MLTKRIYISDWKVHKWRASLQAFLDKISAQNKDRNWERGIGVQDATHYESSGVKGRSLQQFCCLVPIQLDPQWSLTDSYHTLLPGWSAKQVVLCVTAHGDLTQRNNMCTRFRLNSEIPSCFQSSDQGIKLYTTLVLTFLLQCAEECFLRISLNCGNFPLVVTGPAIVHFKIQWNTCNYSYCSISIGSQCIWTLEVPTCDSDHMGINDTTGTFVVDSGSHGNHTLVVTPVAEHPDW